MNKLYRVRLTPDERADLECRISTGKSAARRLARARILLKADETDGAPALSDAEVAAAIEVSLSTVERSRRLFVEEGLEVALAGRERKTAPLAKLDGEREAHLLALACSAPPLGYKRWTLRLLAARMVELDYVDDLSYETVRRTLKKTSSSPGGAPSGAFRRARTRNSSPRWKPS
jgi:transposase